ncbi:MAG: hypothetical protein ACYTCU_07255, partial [Planctomycetota bacterium]
REIDMSFRDARAHSFPPALIVAIALVALAPIGTGQCQIEKLTALGGSTLDDFGSAVAIDGGFAAVAQRGDDDAGSVWTFAFTAGGWVRTGEILPVDGFAGQEFGASLAMSGRTLLVGAPSDDDSGIDAGAVYVYFRDTAGTPLDPSDDTWDQVDKLTASDPAAPTLFGTAVSLDGNLAAVGAPGLAAPPAAVYVLSRDDNGTPGLPDDDVWTEDATLGPDGASLFTRFGAAVALDGIDLLVGDTLDQEVGANSGAAYIFQAESFGDGARWVLEHKWLPPVDPDFNLFGKSVALHEGVAVVGAPGWVEGVDGRAYLYERIGPTSGYGPPLAIDNPTGTMWASFGSAVAVADDRVLVGAPLLSFQFYSGGRVWGWEKVDGVWPRTIDVQFADQSLGDHFGVSIAMSGATALVGGTGYVGVPGDDFLAPYEGAAAVFALDRDSPWTDLGFALGPEAPEPRLVGWGGLVEAQPVTLKLYQARADSIAALVVGLDRIDQPFKGGTMVPRLDVVLTGLPTDAIGELLLSAPWLREEQVPTGTTFVFQAWIVDPGSPPAGWSASNGLEAAQP